MEFSMFTYPAKITKDGDFFLVSFRDFYGNEPVTQGQTYEEALSMASDWLLSEATIALDDKEKLPKASPAKKGEVLIRMPLSAQIKLRLLYEISKKNEHQTPERSKHNQSGPCNKDRYPSTGLQCFGKRVSCGASIKLRFQVLISSI